MKGVRKMKRVLTLVLLVVGLSSCGHSPEKPAGADMICKAMGDVAKLDSNLSSWVCVDPFSGGTDYVFS